VVSAAQVDVETSIEEITGDMGILDVKNLGTMSTDGDNDRATAVGVGSVTVPAGSNTFTASYRNEHDLPLDGQGAIFRLTVWDAGGTKRVDEIKVDAAAAGTLEVSLNSLVKGDGQYELWCETHDWFDTVKATDSYIGVIHFV
jgi:hypothetical protein